MWIIIGLLALIVLFLYGPVIFNLVVMTAMGIFNVVVWVLTMVVGAGALLFFAVWFVFQPRKASAAFRAASAARRR